MPSMSRYWRIYRTFFSSSLARELEFRANFFAKILQNAVWIFFFVMILLVVYGNTKSVAGWNEGDALVLAASVFAMNAVSQMFFFSVTEIPQMVRLGTLDFIVTKPIDSQFWVSIRKFSFDQIGSFVAGVVMLALGLQFSGVHPSAIQWIVYLALMVCSLAMFYSFTLAMMTTGIWLVRVDNLWVLAESATQIARYPMDIYGMQIQRFFTYLVPLAFLATIPARQLVRSLDPAMAALAVLWAAISVLLARLFWRFAVTQYASASS